MAHPIIWPNKIYFYPIGNTPPICLTELISPDSESVDVLLLGCGDPRNILFTISSDTARNRSLDFTCCDIEPAVLARNVLLFTLFNEYPQETSAIWDIFYHFFLNEHARSLLSKQCGKLASLSVSLETWQNGDYPFIHFSDKHTLLELRRHWTLYVEAADPTLPTANRLANIMRNGMADVRKGNKSGYSSPRSAGVAFVHGLATNGLFDKFWESGTTFFSADEISAAEHVNPTFSYSLSESKYRVHYGTCPISAFHLAPALMPQEGSDTNSLNDVQKLVLTARSQFTAWAAVFCARVASSSIAIRCFAGDAIAFSATLERNRQLGALEADVYVSPWSTTRLVLDGAAYAKDSIARAPVVFDVIESSNLVDHMGLMNVLVCCVPLLRRSPQAVLYTEALLPMGKDSTYSFPTRVCGDMTMMSLLLGVTPASFISGFTTESNRHEIMMTAFSETTSQYHERVAWRRPEMVAISIAPVLNFDANDLAATLFTVYQEMFADENWERKFRDISVHSVKQYNLIHYIRATFASLLKLIQQRIDATTWNSTMEKLCQLIVGDISTLMGMNFYQDLCCNLQHLGVYTPQFLTPEYISSEPDGLNLYRGWKTIPVMTVIVLVVPRSRLRPLEELSASEMGTPILHCSTFGPGGSNAIFASIKPMFGRLEIIGTGDGKVIRLHEDPLGLDGTSDMVVSFRVTTGLLLGQMPQLQKVCLAIRDTPQTTMAFLPKLGLGLNLFKADVRDSRYVHLVKDPHSRQDSPIQPTSSGPCIHVIVNRDKPLPGVKQLTIRINVTSQDARKELQSGANVHAVQIGPSTMLLSFGHYKEPLQYPLLVDGLKSNLRIARKSSWIEIGVPPARMDVNNPNPWLANIFPIVVNDGHLTLWNVHSVNVNSFPVIDISNPKPITFLNAHVALQMSDRERNVKETLGGKPSDTMIEVKEAIHILLTVPCDLQSMKQTFIFGLADPNIGIYTIFFVTGIRHDLAAHTIVADAYVLPLTQRTMQNPVIIKTLPKLAGICHINTTLKDEVKTWKRLLPAFVERCRNWKHTPNCNYIIAGKIPLTEVVDESPICNCGRGKSVDRFVSKMKAYRNLAPFVTRVAISPLFAVSYMEAVGRFISAKVDKAHVGRTTRSGDNQTNNCCAKCGQPGRPSLQRCSRCRSTWYCSAVCQKHDWAMHKSTCKPL